MTASKQLSRETISGVLHATVTPKRRGGLLDQYLVGVLTDMGRITFDDRKFYYAPRYYLTPVDGEDRVRLWSFKGQPKALSVDKRGHLVTVRATLEFWSNRIGAHLIRPQVIEVSDDRVTGHACDSPYACATQKESVT